MNLTTFCAVDVAEAVAGGGGEEGDVYFDGALFDGAGAAAVASDDDGDVYFCLLYTSRCV